LQPQLPETVRGYRPDCPRSDYGFFWNLPCFKRGIRKLLRMAVLNAGLRRPATLGWFLGESATGREQQVFIKFEEYTNAP
jgi:hypothetical protein